MKLYLAGPMSGLPQCNFPAFDAAAARLREAGYDVVSPAELDDPEIRALVMADQEVPLSWGTLLARDIQVIADECGGVVVLPGWAESRGARLEVFTAKLLGYTVFRYVHADGRSYLGRVNRGELVGAFVSVL